MHEIEGSTQVNDWDRSQQRVGAVVQFLAGTKPAVDTLSEVAHDARNMVTVLSLYCDLLAAPGVFHERYAHYAKELRIVAAASRRLVEKLMRIDVSDRICTGPVLPPPPLPQNPLPAWPTSQAGSVPDAPIDNLQKELLGNQNLLETIVGTSVTIHIRTEGGARPVLLSHADLIRVLINLVKNAAQAMRNEGTIDVTLRELPDAHGAATTVALIVEDSGPGIPDELLETIFASGYSTQTWSADEPREGGWPRTHHGLGLAITRSVVEAAGGTIRASNRPEGGARFTLELPVRI